MPRLMCITLDAINIFFHAAFINHFLYAAVFHHAGYEVFSRIFQKCHSNFTISFIEVRMKLNVGLAQFCVFPLSLLNLRGYVCVYRRREGGLNGTVRLLFLKAPFEL